MKTDFFLNQEKLRPLVDKVMVLQNSLLQRLALIRKSKIDICNVGVKQRENIIKFLKSVDHLLLTLVSKPTFNILEFR